MHERTLLDEVVERWLTRLLPAEQVAIDRPCELHTSLVANELDSRRYDGRPFGLETEAKPSDEKQLIMI